jgi:hypothetical protein
MVAFRPRQHVVENLRNRRIEAKVRDGLAALSEDAVLNGWARNSSDSLTRAANSSYFMAANMSGPGAGNR